MTKVFLRRGAHKRVAGGHPWVYQTEVEHIEGDFVPGDIVDVVNFRGDFLARGYINARSQIIVRVLSYHPETIDREFFRRRIHAAWEYRRRFLADPEYCRVIFAEADFLPALIVDKFGPYLVIQTLAAGMAVRQDMIVELLDELFSPEGIYERNDVPVRELEGLAQSKGYLKGEFPTLITVFQNGLPFYADIANGQKTGFFFDQRDNLMKLKPIMPGARVLDCFCHTGSFSIHAAKFGARDVTAIDISDFAVGLARENATLNGVTGICHFRVANAFDELRALAEAREQFDVVILDPPAFAKNRGALEGAARGYKEINLRAMKILRDGGYLVTCSCSYHMDRELFLAVIGDAARDAGKTLRLIESCGQAKDHPVLLAASETNYLKFLMFEVRA